jgi:hypothetical protein
MRHVEQYEVECDTTRYESQQEISDLGLLMVIGLKSGEREK